MMVDIESKNYLSKVPPEIIRHILFKLSVDDVLKVCFINKQFKQIIYIDYFWLMYVNKNINITLLEACIKGYVRLTKALLRNKRVKPTFYGSRALILASKYKHLEIIKLLLDDKRADPSIKYNYIIRYASKHGHTSVVKLLLKDSRVDPSVGDNLAIRQALKNDHMLTVRLLLKDYRVLKKL